MQVKHCIYSVKLFKCCIHFLCFISAFFQMHSFLKQPCIWIQTRKEKILYIHFFIVSLFIITFKIKSPKLLNLSFMWEASLIISARNYSGVLGSLMFPQVTLWLMPTSLFLCFIFISNLMAHKLITKGRQELFHPMDRLEKLLFVTDAWFMKVKRKLS